jgi:hypothetical protein
MAMSPSFGSGPVTTTSVTVMVKICSDDPSRAASAGRTRWRRSKSSRSAARAHPVTRADGAHSSVGEPQ